VAEQNSKSIDSDPIDFFMTRATFWVLLLNGLLVGAILYLFRVLDPPRLGAAIEATTFLYLLLVPLAALLRGHNELFSAWLFLVPLAFFQIVPDLILASQLHVLGFTQLGGYRIGPVPAYMPGLWVAGLLTIVWLGEVVHTRSAKLAVAAVAIGSITLFGAAGWGANRLPLWHAHGVRTYQGIALYALAAEVLLGLATWLMFVQVQSRTIVAKVAGAAAVSMFYTGALVVLHLAFSRF
jgi:hypothetical protein